MYCANCHNVLRIHDAAQHFAYQECFVSKFVVPTILIVCLYDASPDDVSLCGVGIV